MTFQVDEGALLRGQTLSKKAPDGREAEKKFSVSKRPTSKDVFFLGQFITIREKIAQMPRREVLPKTRPTWCEISIW